MLTPRATIDFESRSACSIKNCGSWRYSLDPSTEVLCMAFRLPHWAEGRTGLWHPAHANIGLPERFDWADMTELVNWINAHKLIEAHNAWFERGMWVNQLVPKFDFPPIAWDSWRCSAAKAASHALPRKLEDTAVILSLEEQKDEAGHKLMKKLAKPRRARKAEIKLSEETGRPLEVLYFESVDMFNMLCDYCRQDVLTEDGITHALPDLDETETQVYLLDQKANERGFSLDKDAVDTALHLIAGETTRLNGELAVVTNNYITKATQRVNLLTWLQSEGVWLPNTQKTTIIDTFEREGNRMTPNAKRAMEILQELGRSSTAKYTAMRNWRCPDGKAHGGLLYHGAGTGRWSGAGVQPQNFPKGKIKDMDAVWDLLHTRDRFEILQHYPNVMELVSWALRGAIVPSKGKQLYVADYASIEARVLPWMAGDEDTLAMFRTGADPYCVMASDIYGYECNKNDHPNERALGKVAILGLGYQMGWSKFIDTVWLMARIQIDEDLSRRTVDAYRERFWRTKEMWNDTEQAAMEAVETGEPVECGKVTFHMTEGEEGYQFLYCTLPSGRRLAYPDPYVRPKRMPWGEMRNALTFMGIHPKIRQWIRQDTYGGMLVENIDQAISRDLMAAAMLRCEDHPTYSPILTVHDELIAEADLGTGNVHEFEQLMAACPPWATNCPVAAEGWTGMRYRK